MYISNRYALIKKKKRRRNVEENVEYNNASFYCVTFFINITMHPKNLMHLKNTFLKNVHSCKYTFFW